MNHPTEQIEAAVVGALTPTEQAAFDEHVAGCPACAGLLAEAKAADAAMNELFAGHRPDDDFEERMIANIRRKQVRITHPLVRRIAVGVAASIVLGGIGYVGSAEINGRGLPGYSLLGQTVGAGNAVLSQGRSSARLYEHNVKGAKLLDGQISISQLAVTDATLPPDPIGGAGATATLQPPVPPGLSPPPAPVMNTTNGFGFSGSNPATGKKVEGSRQWMMSRNPASAPPAPGFESKLQRTDDGAPHVSRFMNNGNADAGQKGQRGATVAQADINGRQDLGEVEKLAKSQKDSNHLYFKVSDGEQSWGSVVRDNYSFVGGLSAGSGRGRGSNDELRKTAGDSKKLSEEFKDLNAYRTTKAPSKDSGPAGGGIGAGGGGSGDVDSKKIVEELASKPDMLRKYNPSNGTESQKSKATVLTLATDGKPDSGAAAFEDPRTAPVADPAHPDVLTKPKIIRTGEMEFEVNSFDSTVGTINKVIAEEQGYISTTNSDKLANGKVKGSVVLRVPAEHLDTLVLKLRGIGDLRSQHINAQDITKQFTDTESALRAAKAMQERLLDIIKNGKGAVKDLLEAEKQLGVWREKVEQLEGEIRYYSNQVSMSTLTLTLYERDIRQPALASETETVTMALETDKVDDAYAKAKEAIAEAKGRIVNSELKQFDAGQFGATIVAQVPPDAADAVLGRLKQFDGRIARFERQRNQTTSNGNAPSDGRLSADPVKVKREDVTINLTLYNLANVAPRRTTTLTVVASDVEKSYHALIDQVRSAGGRVITSQINRGKEDQVAGAVNFNVPTEKADVLLAALRGWGEVLKTETAESPDTQNVTESKRGFNVTIGSLSAFPARETQQIQLAAVGVPDAFNDLLSALRTGAARIIASRLNELDRGNANATLEFEIRREAAGAIEQAMAKDGQVITRAVNRSTDTDNTVDSKLHIAIAFASSEQLPPRQSTEMSVEVSDVQKAMEDLQAAALTAGGRQVDNPAISQGDNGQTTATLTVDVPLDKVSGLIESADGKGTRKSRRTSIDAHAPEGKLARARLTVTFATPATLTGNDGGALAGIRSGLGTSLRGLSYSLMMIIIGVCLVAPWALLIGGIWRAVKWAKKNRAPAAAV